MKRVLTSLRDRLGALSTSLLDGHATKSYAQEGEDIVLTRILQTPGPGFYVDVGAHHPRRFSNTCLFYQRGWRGINVEPNPAAIRQFQRERPRDINLQVGIAEAPGLATYHEFDEPALNTFAGHMVDRLEGTTYKLVRTLEIPLVRLDAVLREHLPPGQRIDFLSVDVEGADLSALKSNDWSSFRPVCVLAEVLGAHSMQDVLDGDIARFMLQQGYVLSAKTLNSVFFLEQRRG